MTINRGVVKEIMICTLLSYMHIINALQQLNRKV